METIVDPELVRLIVAMKDAAAEEDRLQDLLNEAEERHGEAEARWNELRDAVRDRLLTHEVRDGSGSLVQHRTFAYGGMFYTLDAHRIPDTSPTRLRYILHDDPLYRLVEE